MNILDELLEIADIDLEATRKWYAGETDYDCPCSGCRNFVELARRRQLPEHALALLDALGIRPTQATYVCMYIKQGDGVLGEYNYRLCGDFRKNAPSIHWEDSDFRLSRSPQPPIDNSPDPYVDLQFCGVLPWVLDEENTY